MMDTSTAAPMSTKDKTIVVLAGMGVYLVGASVLTGLYLILHPYVILLLGIPSTDLWLQTFATFFPHLAVVPATMLIGWLMRTSGWLYGLVGGLCMRLPGTAVSSIPVIQLSLNLLRNPDVIYQGFGTAPLGITQLWLVTVLIPPVVAAALGALGGFCGQRCYQRFHHESVAG